EGVAVCVLTGLADEHLGMAAVAEGAQDYLIKGRVDGTLLSRAIRYAVERRRADENALRLREAELRTAESRRLERGLLPQPLIEPGLVALEAFYRPGRQRALLGGDVYDAVPTGPGRPAMMLGVFPDVDAEPRRVPLPPGWALLVYTDGLIEGRAGDGRLGVGGLCRLVAEHRRSRAPFGELPDWLVAEAEQRNGDPLA